MAGFGEGGKPYILSSGLMTADFMLRTWVYIWVVERCACPRSSCIVRISQPSSSRWVAKECLKTWGVTIFGILASLAACLTAFWIVLSCM